MLNSESQISHCNKKSSEDENEMARGHSVVLDWRLGIVETERDRENERT